MEPDTRKVSELHSGVTWVMPSGGNERYIVIEWYSEQAHYAKWVVTR